MKEADELGGACEECTRSDKKKNMSETGAFEEEIIEMNEERAGTEGGLEAKVKIFKAEIVEFKQNKTCDSKNRRRRSIIKILTQRESIHVIKIRSDIKWKQAVEKPEIEGSKIPCGERSTCWWKPQEECKYGIFQNYNQDAVVSGGIVNINFHSAQ